TTAERWLVAEKDRKGPRLVKRRPDLDARLERRLASPLSPTCAHHSIEREERIRPGTEHAVERAKRSTFAKRSETAGDVRGEAERGRLDEEPARFERAAIIALPAHLPHRSVRHRIDRDRARGFHGDGERIDSLARQAQPRREIVSRSGRHDADGNLPPSEPKPGHHGVDGSVAAARDDAIRWWAFA